MEEHPKKNPRARPISAHRLARFFPDIPVKAAGPQAMKSWRALQRRLKEVTTRFDRLEPKAQNLIEAVLDFGDTTKGHEEACELVGLGGKDLTPKEKRRVVAHVLNRFDVNRVFLDLLHLSRRDRLDPVRYRSIVKGAIEEVPPAADLAQLSRVYAHLENADNEGDSLDDTFGIVDSLVGRGAVDSDGLPRVKDAGEK